MHEMIKASDKIIRTKKQTALESRSGRHFQSDFAPWQVLQSDRGGHQGF